MTSNNDSVLDGVTVEKPKAKPNEIINKVSVFKLYRFAGTTEKILIGLGTVVSLAFGVCTPLLSIIMGGSIGDFGKGDDETYESVKDRCLIIVFVGIAAFFLSGLAQILWTLAGDRLAAKVKKLYLEALLKKDVTWFDLNRPQELPTKIVSLATKYQDGIGEKVGKCLVAASSLISGLIISFSYGWQLAFVVFGLFPVMMIAIILMGKAHTIGMEATKRGYAKCGGYAEEALSAIRTVYAFCAEKIEQNKYLSELSNAQQATAKSSLYLGVGLGLLNFAMGVIYGVGYFVGSFFIQYEVRNHSLDKNYDCSSVVTVFMSAMFAIFSLGLVAPQMKGIAQAQASAYDIYEIIDSVADVSKNAPTKKLPLETFRGEIEFRNVTFYYPTRPDIKVLHNFSMSFKTGTMTGICGETGSGKSTIIQLIERFYKPSEGEITVDGVDINTLDLKWWRETIGYVGQEPVLFNTSIKENIKYGKPGASMEEIESAARNANAEEFIIKLKDGYDTITGTEGSKMSGGQKQRLAIARCLIKKPRILLLDEATSALDNTSEKKVQEAFNKLQQENGMTILAIAHRLSTIKKADNIIVLHDGVLKEQGTDEELRTKENTIYANLCRLQEGIEEKKDEFENLEEVKVEERIATRENIAEQNETKNSIREDKSKETKFKTQIWKENFKHKLPFIMAIILGALSGLNFPMIGLLYGKVSIDLLETDKSELRKKVNIDFIGFVATGVAVFLLTSASLWLFGYVASKVTYRLREALYTKILKMNVGWFDLTENLPSNLNNTLSEGTEKINDVVSLTAVYFIESAAALVFGLIISFIFSWKMSLIMLVCAPVLCLGSFIETKTEIGIEAAKQRLYKDSMQILSETVKNFRTVASFSSEDRVLKIYGDSLEGPLAESKREAIIIGLQFGFSQCVTYFSYATLFYFASLFMKHYGDDPRDMFMATFTLFFTANFIGQTQQHAPDVGKAYAALNTIYEILEQAPTITSPAEPSTNEIKGKIEFKNVCFKYPTRSDYILQDFNATINEGQKVAIVGMSGSGKSTIVQLLERFYDIESGQILIDGVDIKEYSLVDLRKAIGYVPQEPVLFDTTVEDNVRYGSEDKNRAEVTEACEIADAIDFIMKDLVETLPHQNEFEGIDIGKGFERKVGAKGSLLSGGQKQRLAIARAVLKKPKIMLFDEATSALDSETEKVVQKALNDVSKGRTSIVVAHRLGTIEDDDTILVLEHGKVVETGNKRELENKKGSFHKLYKGNTH